MCVFGSFLAGWRACERHLALTLGSPYFVEPAPLGPPPKVRCHFSSVRASAEYIALMDDDIGVSMTNDAENVIAWMSYHSQLPDHRRLFYRDTTRRWDEMIHKDGKFVGFKAVDVSTIEAYDLPIG
jgi:hypothetical protein